MHVFPPLVVLYVYVAKYDEISHKCQIHFGLCLGGGLSAWKASRKHHSE